MSFLSTLWNYILISAPFLLIGLLVAGFIHSFISVERIKKAMGGKSFWAVIKAALLGIPLPLCSCGVIPTAVTLKKNGASNGATSSFLISTPESGVDSIAMTYAMMDLPMTIIRPVAAFFSAFFAGVLQFMFNEDTTDPSEIEDVKSCCPSQKKEEVKVEKTSCCPSKKVEVVEEKTSCCPSKKSEVKSSGCGSKTMNPSDLERNTFAAKVARMFKFGYFDLLDDLAGWLTLGIIVGASIDFFVPADIFGELNGYAARALILAIGIPMYICASATTPIAASLVLKGMSPGTALLILLVGPATNISNILVLQKYIGKKGILINVFSIAFVALIMSFLTDYLYTLYSWPVDFKIAEHDHGNGTYWLKVAAGVLFSALLARSLVVEYILKKIRK